MWFKLKTRRLEKSGFFILLKACPTGFFNGKTASPKFQFSSPGRRTWGIFNPCSIKVLLQLAQWFLRRRFLCEFPIGSYVKLSSAVGAILVEGPNRRNIFGREPSNDYLIKILFLLSKWFQTRRFLWEFAIGSYVKLSSAVLAIFVGILKCRTQFWKRTTQESFQQSLVEIGSVVSQEKIFF